MKKSNMRMLKDYVNYCACWEQLSKTKRFEILETVTIKIDYVECNLISCNNELSIQFLNAVNSILSIINSLGCIGNEFDKYNIKNYTELLQTVNTLYKGLYNA